MPANLGLAKAGGANQAFAPDIRVKGISVMGIDH